MLKMWHFWIVTVPQAAVAFLQACVWSYWRSLGENRQLAQEFSFRLKATQKQDQATAQLWFDNLRQTATRVCCESPQVDARKQPHWYDEEKWRRGQQVAHFYYSSQIFASVAGASTFESQLPGLLIPIVRNGKTTTVTGVYHRFLNSVRHEALWCNPESGDPFDCQSSCYESMEEIRILHQRLFAKMNKDDPDGVRRKGVVWVNQYDMVCTQFAIIGIGVVHPGAVGLHSITKEEWADLLYLWRVVGHCMGIEDQYNLFSSGDLNQNGSTSGSSYVSAYWRCRQIMEDESSVREDPTSVGKGTMKESSSPSPGCPFFNSTSNLTKSICDQTHQVGMEIRQVAGDVVAPIMVPVLFGWHAFLYYWHEALGWPQEEDLVRNFSILACIQYILLRIVFGFVLRSRDGHSWLGHVIRQLRDRELAVQRSRAKELNRKYPPAQLHWKILLD